MIDAMTTEGSSTEVVSTLNPSSKNKRASMKEALEAAKEGSQKNFFQR